MLASNTETTATKYGKMTFYADDQFVGHALKQYGEYSDGEVELWRKFVKPGDTVADVGANIGSLTLGMARLVMNDSGGVVLAFEPQPENFALLKRNVEQNELQARVTLYDCALGDRDDITISIPYLGDLDHTNYGRVEAGHGSHAVALLTLDSYNIKQLRLLKIDVEGMEAAVLRGAAETIKRCRPLLYVENDRAEKSDELLRLIRGMDYRLYLHQPLLWTPNNFKQAPLTDRPIISINLLCVPSELVEEFAAQGIMDGLTMVVPPSYMRQGKAGWAGIVRLGGIGDNLIAAAVLKPLKAMGYKIDVISQEPQSCVFENNPYVDKLSIKMSARDLPQDDMWTWQKYWRARSYEYDRFANLSHSSENLLAQFRMSTAYWWPAPFRRKLCGRSYLETVCDIVGVPYDFGPLFWPTEEEREQAAATKRIIGKGGKPVVGWALTGTRVDKIYPQSAMAIGRLIRELDVVVVMFGAPLPYPDFKLAEEIEKTVIFQNGSNKGLHLALSPVAVNSWPIRRILSQALTCDLMIGPDTGPMWGVAMEPMPKIMLHSHASPENITKHWVNTASLTADPSKVPCWPCHLLHDEIATCREMQIEAGLKPSDDDKGAACMSNISAEAIITTAAKLLH